MVSVHPPTEIDLGQPVQPDRVDRVEEQAEVHPVPGLEGESLQQGAAAGVLTGQRLGDPGQPRPVQVHQRAGHQLGHPAGGPGVGALHEVHRRIGE